MVKQDISIIRDYFEHFTDVQISQLDKFAKLVTEWNDKINMVSRKDIDMLIPHHILHSLGIVKTFKFIPGTRILDLGTGGGLPGIPMAIAYPEVNFHLVDARAKKIMVVNEVIEALQLKNVKAEHIRAEELNTKYDFVVSRAVARLDKLLFWSRSNISKKEANPIPNGLIALKGGELSEIKAEVPKHEYIEHHNLEEIFKLEYYKEKYIIYVQS